MQQTWTVLLQHDGPNCLGLWFDGLSSNRMALIASDCGSIRSPPLLPNLQQIPPGWPQPPKPNTPLPVVLIPHPDEAKRQAGVTCNTYFHTPENNDLRPLNAAAAQNREHPACLLLEFFRYYAHEVREHLSSLSHCLSSLSHCLGSTA